MSNTTSNNAWHGIPREQINWHPTVIAERCIGWMREEVCVIGNSG